MTKDISEREQAEEFVRQALAQERRQRQVADSLRQVATILNRSLDLPTVLAKILEQLGQVVPNDGMGIFLAEDESLRLVAGLGPAAQEHIGASMSLASQNPTVRVFHTQRLLIIDDLKTEPHWLVWPDGQSIQAWMGAPLIIERQVIGVLTVDSLKADAYDEENGQILKTFANQAALAIRNARLFETLRQYERIVSATPDGFALVDHTYVYRIVNQVYLNLYEKSYDQIVGHPVSELLGREIFEEVVKKNLDRALAGETINCQTWVEYKSAGRRFMSITYFPYLEPDGAISGVVVIGRDLTELELLQERLRESQKMEAVGQLAAGLAHHFNNMLTAIIGFTSLSLSKLPASHPIADNLSYVESTAQQAAILVSQLLSFARKQLIRPQVVNLNDLILNTQSKLSEFLPASIEVRTALAPDLGQIKMDVNQFDQLLTNLVANAGEAMPLGGRLTLATANVSLAAGEAGQPFEVSAGDYILLTVGDTGVGMTEEIKKHLFEPFFTTKDVGQGTGLGLPTCFGIVKQHGGHITVDSQPGRGTTFKVYLPRWAE